MLIEGDHLAATVASSCALQTIDPKPFTTPTDFDPELTHEDQLGLIASYAKALKETHSGGNRIDKSSLLPVSDFGQEGTRAFLARISFDNLDVDLKGTNCSDGVGITKAIDHLPMDDRLWRAVKQLRSHTDRTASGLWAITQCAVRSASWVGIPAQQLLDKAFGPGVFKVLPWERVPTESLRCGGRKNTTHHGKECGEWLWKHKQPYLSVDIVVRSCHC